VRNQYVEVLVSGPDNGTPVVKYVEVDRHIIEPEKWAERLVATEGYIVLASRRWIQTGM
jgi:hypothetical protein